MWCTHRAVALNAQFARCLEHAGARRAKPRALAGELLNEWGAFWVVLCHSELPLTNDAAEPALRNRVIGRRICYGARSAQGSRARGARASVIDICRQRGLSLRAYIAEVLYQRRQGILDPALLPVFVT